MKCATESDGYNLRLIYNCCNIYIMWLAHLLNWLEWRFHHNEYDNDTLHYRWFYIYAITSSYSGHRTKKNNSVFDWSRYKI